MRTFIEDTKADLIANGGRSSLSSMLKFFLFNPGFQVIFLHRLSILFHSYLLPGKIMSLILWRLNIFLSGCHISRLASIGAGVHFPHPIGIVIGGGCTIATNVTIYQNVTLGRRHVLVSEYPTINSGTVLCSGAQVLGRAIIGTNCVIAANTIVMQDVPDNSVVYGMPNKFKKVEL